MALYVATGTYTGTGSAQSISGLGFAPKAVMIRGASGTGAFATDTMDAGYAKPISSIGQAQQTNRVSSFDADGFTLGTDTSVNANGSTFAWIAWGGTGCFTTTYTGNGTDDRSITGAGFDPIFALTFSESASRYIISRSNTMSADSAKIFGNLASAANHIQSLITDGMQVGSGSYANQNTETYHAVMFENDADAIDTATYTGNGTSQSIGGFAWTADTILIGGESSNRYMVWKHISQDGTSSAYLLTSTTDAASVSDITATGFDVSTSNNVNANTETYHAIGFHDNLPASGGTFTRDVPASAALSGTFTRTVPASAALQATLSRTVPASAALYSILSREVPASAALQATLTRTVAASAALSGTFSRSVPASASISGGTTRNVPASAALSATETRDVPASAALQSTLSRTVAASAALQATLSRTVAASAALSGTEERTVPASAALSGTFARDISASAALQATLTRTVPASASLVAVLTRTVPASAALQSTLTRSVPASASLRLSGDNTPGELTYDGFDGASHSQYRVSDGAQYSTYTLYDGATASRYTLKERRGIA